MPSFYPRAFGSNHPRLAPALLGDAPGERTKEGNMLHVVGFLAANDSSVDIGSILGYIVVGLVVGILARFLLPGRDPMGLIATIIVGILGAVIGGWAAGAIFSDTAGVDWIASIIVAIVLLLIWRAVTSRSDVRH
jgi:uncharacterized membrane protein YeaQ/YmgE (transglycosylase-associated protein family)